MSNFIVDRSLLGANQNVYKQAIAKLNTASTSKMTDQEKFEKYQSLDYKAKAALRTEAVDLRVKANMIGMDFFELKTLEPDEVPVYEVEASRPRIPITVVSQFGGSAETVWSDNLSRAAFELGMLESNRCRVQRFDLYQGFTNKNNKLNTDISESLTNQLDDMAWVAVEAGIGYLDANTWILDAKIKNAPTSNLLDLSAECQGKLTKNLFKALKEHSGRVGRRLRAVYLPGAREQDLFDWVSVTDGVTNTAADTVPASVQEQIWNSGSTGGFLMPPTIFTNVLEGETEGSIYGYAILDQAPGYFFQKPAFHMTDEKDEGIWHYAQTVITGSFVIPAYRKQNIIKFKIG
jgi:hypothetical protein